MKKILVTFLAYGSFTLTPSLFAQEGLVATSPTARTVVSTDLAKLLESAFPAYDDAILAKRLTEAGKQLQARKDEITVRNLRTVERIMGFTPSTSPGTEIDTPAAYYRVDAARGKVYAQHKNDSFVDSSRSVFAGMEAEIAKQQRALVTTMGVPQDELMKVGFKQVLVQSLNDQNRQPTDGTPAQVRRGMTLGYRGFRGFPIEGSFVRISSFTSKRVENMALSWPVFVLHPEVTTFALASKEVIKREILSKLKESATPSQPLSLNMGVVFQPVRTREGRLVHIPAMKVVLTPAAHVTTQGTQTEGGLEFFANILKVAPAVQPGNATDGG